MSQTKGDVKSFHEEDDRFFNINDYAWSYEIEAVGSNEYWGE